MMKDRMAIEGQLLLLTFTKDVKEHLVSSFKEIGNAWKSIPFQVKKAGKIKLK